VASPRSPGRPLRARSRPRAAATIPAVEADDAPATRPPLLTLQRGSLWLGAACFLLGLLATGGCSPFPAGEPDLAWLLHPLVLFVGGAAGMVAAARGREIERERWRVIEQPGLTKGERELAHREAEADRKRAGIAFLLAPVGIGFALATHFSIAASTRVADVVLVTALAGFALGLWLGGRRRGEQPPLA
jgi:hypothetical protein